MLVVYAQTRLSVQSVLYVLFFYGILLYYVYYTYTQEKFSWRFGLAAWNFYIFFYGEACRIPNHEAKRQVFEW